MAEIVEYTNYTANGVFIIKKYDFCPELWDIIKQYMGIYGIPVDFVPRFLKLKKTDMCRVSERLMGYNPANGYNLQKYKKDRLIKNILTVFFNKISKDYNIPIMYKIRLAINYMDRI
jgi:hypothetical protein